MSLIAKNILELVGHTPLLNLSELEEGSGANIYGKCEFLNPSGSVKDRAALAMIETAEAEGLLDEETVVIEPTSGNTGIALAMVCAYKGYKLIITMPESMSIERQRILKAYGAEVVLTPAHMQMNGAIQEAKTIAKCHKKHFIPQQFNNPANPTKHYNTTAVEIFESLKGQVDAIVFGVGTGGSIAGCAKFLKEKKPDIQVVALEPADSSVLSGQKAGPHMIQGIGAGFIPENYDSRLVDEIIGVQNDDAIQMSRRLARELGVFCGISAGANVFGATQLAKRDTYVGKNIVTILCDVGERYLSTPIFDEVLYEQLKRV